MTTPSCAVKKFTKRLNHSAANIHIIQFVLFYHIYIALFDFFYIPLGILTVCNLYTQSYYDQSNNFGTWEANRAFFGTIFGHWSRSGPSPEIGILEGKHWLYAFPNLLPKVEHTIQVLGQDREANYPRDDTLSTGKFTNHRQPWVTADGSECWLYSHLYFCFPCKQSCH